MWFNAVFARRQVYPSIGPTGRHGFQDNDGDDDDVVHDDDTDVRASPHLVPEATN